jgi:hypothetical protein
MQLRRSRNNKQSISRQCCNNHFDLLNNEIECYNYHNFGHKAANCHLKNCKEDPRIKLFATNASTWKKKDSGKCGLVLSTQKQKESWNIDNGCYKHMTREKDKVLPISKRKTGNVIFENDEPGKIKDKGMVSLSNGEGDSQDDLLVDDLKHNLLSISKMCDRGCEEVFMSKNCKVKNVNSGQVVVIGIRTDNDVDIESSHARREELEEESCHKMEAEVVNLRKKVEKSNTQIKFLNSSVILDEILDSQRSPNEKSSIGYNKEEINTPKKSNIGPSFVKRKRRYESVCNGFFL